MMDRARFYDFVRPHMPSDQITSVQFGHLQAVVDGLETRAVNANQAAYILATAHHETDHWRVLEEYASGRAYEWRKDLGNTQSGDGARFKGRGFVMITGRRNYTDWSKRAGVDFVSNPSLVSEPEYAVRILIDGMSLGTFTGKSLGEYVNENKSDFYNARRVVNGTDRATLIAGYANNYLNALHKSGYEVSSPKKDGGVREYDLTGAKFVMGPGFVTFKWTGLKQI